jgi:hypothetical protein
MCIHETQLHTLDWQIHEYEIEIEDHGEEYDETSTRAY